VFSSLLGAGSGVSGSGTLLSIHFDTLIPDISSLHFSDLVFLNSYANELDLTGVDGTVDTLATVPEPTSALLLGIGAIALLARRRGAFAQKLSA
jgi:hypothetical protein